MPDRLLSEEMQRRVEAFCEDVAGACGLPDEARIELRDHFQDRMLGYLTGADPVTEDDAFCLAREHFGDVETVRELFRVAHDAPATPRSRLLWLGPILVLVGFAFAFSGLLVPASTHTWITRVLPWLDYPSGCMTFSFLGSVVLLAWGMVYRRRAPRMVDRLLGWYLLAMGAGILVLVVPSIAMMLVSTLPPLHMLVRMVQPLLVAGLLFVAARGFFKRLAWTRWCIVALLVAPLVSGVAQNLIDDSALQTHAIQARPPETSEHLSHPQEVIPTVVHHVNIPPRGFAEAIYALALVHAFLPRNRRPSPAPAPRQSA